MIGMVLAAGAGRRLRPDTDGLPKALLPVDGDSDPVWFGTDPTNAIIAGRDHVRIGHGRMYADVSPVEGTFSGDAESTVDAHVAMRRVPTAAEDLVAG